MAAPGLNSAEERDAAIALMLPDLHALLSENELQHLTIAKISMARIRSLGRFAVLADSRADMREFCRDTLGLRPGHADDRAEVAGVVEAWEAAAARNRARREAEADASSAGIPRKIQKRNLAEIRSKVEGTYDKLEDKHVPAEVSLEDVFEQVSDGELKYMVVF